MTQTASVGYTATRSLTAKRHALDYWNADGLPTIFRAASYLLFVGGLAVLIRILIAISDPELVMVTFFLGVPTTVFGLTWFAFRSEDFIESLKQRITYPRTGYTAPPHQWKKSERDEISDANYGRFSGVARFLRKRWLFIYGAWLGLQAINDVLGHPLHPSLRFKAAFVVVLGLVGALLRLPRFLRDRLVAIEVLGYPVLGFLAANALRQQELLRFVLLVGFAPGFLVLVRGIVTFIRYVQKNPMPTV